MFSHWFPGGSSVARIVMISLVWLTLSAVMIGHGAAQSRLTADTGVAPGPVGQAPIVIGLDAAMSGGAAQSGEAIRRGLILAMQEINAGGGVLGRQLKLVVRDNRGVTARGIDNIREFARTPNLAAVVGGIHTPVAMAELDQIHKEGLVYLGAWAAGTPVVKNGRTPNFVFRVSIRDEYAGPFLIKAAMKRGFKRPGLLLWRTGWGRSNEAAMSAAMQKLGVKTAGTVWFNTGEADISAQLKVLADAGADVIMLVANPTEGLTFLRNMAALPKAKRIPIISHWGITGTALTSEDLAVISDLDLTVLQSYSFFTPAFPRKAENLLAAYCKKFGRCDGPASVVSPVGTAHAYDLVYLLRKAIEKAGGINTAKIRHALERLGRHNGLVRVYDPPFTPKRHDALDQSDFRLCRYDASGALIPIGGHASR